MRRVEVDINREADKIVFKAGVDPGGRLGVADNGD